MKRMDKIFIAILSEAPKSGRTKKKQTTKTTQFIQGQIFEIEIEI